MFVLKLFDVKGILKDRMILGTLPSNKEVYKTSFKYAWPSTVENVLVSLVGMVDTVMVSSLGQEAIAATGITNQPKFIIMAPILALNIALSVLVARRKGENKAKEANRILSSALFISFIVSLVLSVIGYIFATPIVVFSGAESNYLELASAYFKIIMVGNFFNCLSLTMTSAQMGAGNTRISMYTNVAANVVNIVLNYFLINGIWIFPKLGVAGAAIATAIGCVVSFIIAISSIMKKGRFLHFRFSKPEFSLIQNILSLSKSSFIEQIFLRFGFFIYTMMVAGLGTTYYAAHVVYMTILNLTFSMGNGISVAASSLVGQNLGSKRSDLSYLYSKIYQRIGVLISLVVAILIWFLQVPILWLITDGDTDVIRIGHTVMPVLCLIIAMQIVQVITIGSLRGAGDLKFVASLMLVSVAVIRPILTYLFCYSFGLGLVGAWIGMFLDQGIRNVVSRIRFHNGNWMEINV